MRLIRIALIVLLVVTVVSSVACGSSSHTTQSTPTPAPTATATEESEEVGDPVTLWHMDEGVGDILHDATNNHNDGVINGATWASGKFGQALSFDGENDWVTVNQSFVFHRQTDATLLFWVKIMTAGSYPIFWTRGDEENSNRFNIYVEILHWDTLGEGGQLTGGMQSLFQFSYSSPDGVTHYFRSFQIPTNQWVQIAVTRSGDTYSFYKDGEFVGEVTDDNPDLPDYTGNWFIGRGYLWSPHPSMFRGLIDEVAMYERALSAAEISQLADIPISLSAECNWDGGDCSVGGTTPTSTPTPTPPALGCADWVCGDTWIGGCCDTNENRQYEIAECSNEIVWQIVTGQITPDEACPTPTPTPN